VIPTYIGIIVAAIGFWLLTKPAVYSLAFFAYCTIFAGSSALDLFALGGASVPPANFALLFLILRLWRQDFSRSEAFLQSIVAHRWFIVFCVYSAAMAFVLPTLFAGQVMLVPMGAANMGAMLLRPTAQNITTAVYMLGTAATAVAATMMVLATRTTKIMASTFIMITWIHIATGLLDLGLNAVHLGILIDIVRNGSYAQLDQSFGDVHRIAGITPEPSVYATFGGVCFVLMSEFWLRNIQPRRSGPAALVMLVMLILTTSSTGYVYIAAYGACLWVRCVFIPGSMQPAKMLRFILVQIFGAAALISGIALNPALAKKFFGIIQSVTISKGNSESGVQRMEWARQGFLALRVSHGLGVGVGSFRSSSIMTAILGSVGPIALAVFIIYVLQVWQPLRKSTFMPAASDDLRFAGAAGWGALMTIVAESVVAPSPDPGIIFGLLAGMAIGLRIRDRTPAPRRQIEQPLAAQSAGPFAPRSVD